LPARGKKNLDKPLSVDNNQKMKIDYGPGYRVYYKDTGREIIILLCGGDKRTQQADIANAKKITRHYEEE
jgi:putative addiction module killer protein